MHNPLIELLRSDIAAHDAQLSTTPYLSRIRQTEEFLLRLLELKNGEPEPVDFRDTRIAELEEALRPFTAAEKAGHEDFVHARNALAGRRGEPIHELMGAIRRAIRVYDQSGDHCNHQASSDCVRCNAAAAVYYPDDPRAKPPRKSRPSTSTPG